MKERRLSHVDKQGRASMVDVGDKPTTRRTAVATGWIRAQPDTIQLIADGSVPKGDVLASARLAGIMAAKRTPELIPLCHGLSLVEVAVEFDVDTDAGRIDVTGRAVAVDRTGSEMEALTAVAVACLTIYDMCKAVDRGMVIGDIRLLSKTGGLSGDWTRADGE